MSTEESASTVEDKAFNLDKDSDRVVGTVKWFDAAKGYGFIITDTLSEEVFVHHTEIEQEGYRKLLDGSQVTFIIQKTDNGYSATAVQSAQTEKALETTED